MAKLNELLREYEAHHFPPTRRLDVHGEGPVVARERTLRWIQSFAHEAPGSELLVVVERGARPGVRASPVRRSVEEMLQRLVGGLIDWWQPFGPGSLALRVSLDPRMAPPATPTAPEDENDGRTPETAGALLIEPDADIPDELLPLARRAAELRRTREELSLPLLDVLLRQIWIEAQAAAMSERISFESALDRVLQREEDLAYDRE